MDEPRTDAALFCAIDDAGFLARALAALPPSPATLISDDPAFCPGLAAERIAFAEFGLDATPVDRRALTAAIAGRFRDAGRRLIVDMAWAAARVVGGQSIATWGRVAEALAAEAGIEVISVYAREALIEQHMETALAAHRQFLAPSGLYDNPHWLPRELAQSATPDQQVAYLLGRAVPDYAGAEFLSRDDRMLARGATPDWLQRGPVGPLKDPGGGWHIHCFGQLRVYTTGRSRVDWRIPGGSPRKAKVLFAYLLQRGERGAEAEELTELLWPGTAGAEIKRARLHHTVAMLRKTLGDKDAVRRSGDYYRLNVPRGSWIDITAFEQLCRRGLSLWRSGQPQAALEQYRTAERLYAGDLLAELPADYVYGTHEDWVLARRTWLREMAIKLQCHMSMILRGEGKLAQAHEHCQKALALDPASEEANTETLRVLHAQGRPEAMARQFRQYRAAVGALGASADFHEIEALYRALAGSAPPAGAHTKEKPKAGD